MGGASRQAPRRGESSGDTSCVLLSREVFFYSSRRRHTRSVSAFLLNRSSDLHAYSIVIGGIQGDVLATDNNTVGMGDAGIKSRSEERRVGKECGWRGSLCD